LTVTRESPFMWHKKGNDMICYNDYYVDRPMRQDIKDEDFILHDNGNIYITKSDILFNMNNRLGGKIVSYEIDKFRALQIDTLDDFLLVEQVYNIKNKIV